MSSPATDSPTVRPVDSPELCARAGPTPLDGCVTADDDDPTDVSTVDAVAGGV